MTTMPLDRDAGVRRGVVVERAADLGDEVLRRRGDRAHEVAERRVEAGVPGAPADGLLHDLRLRERHAELLGDGVGDVLAADEQDADEARHAAAVDDDVRHPGADVDERLGLDLGAGLPAEGAQHGERREVHAVDPQARLLGAADVGQHRLAGRGDQQAPERAGSRRGR